MSVYDTDLLGYNKHKMSIARIKQFCDGKRVVCSFSGGKDSQVCYHLLKEANIPFDTLYSITRFEPPELLSFIREHYPDAIFRREYSKSLVDEIAYRGLPNMFARWCCKAKHQKIEGYDVVVIGVRWEESQSRRDSWRMSGYKHDRSFYICPIADWTEHDVWEYLGHRPHCSLYDQGYRRIGCVCCPLVPQKIKEDVKRWPKTAAVLKKGADLFVERMRLCNWRLRSGKQVGDWCLSSRPEEEYWRRWLSVGHCSGTDNTHNGEHQENCLFEGSGFSEKDSPEEDEGE